MKKNLPGVAPVDSQEHSDDELKMMADHLIKAEEIKNNPKLMKKIAPHIKRKAKAIRSLDDLRAKVKELKVPLEAEYDG